MSGPVPRDEARHAAGPDDSWEESWDFDFASTDATLGGFVRVTLRPHRQRASCWVYVLRADGTVVVRDDDAPLPSGDALLVRAEGLWCELLCETPLEHWSIGVEAFGVRLDDPLDGLHGEIGTRLPVGLDLEWEVDDGSGPARPLTSSDGYGYEQLGAVRGDVLLGREVIPFDGIGRRRHEWGARDWSTPARRVSCAARPPVDVEPLLHAYVPLPGDGGAAYLTRSLARCTLADGRVAPGWLESLERTEPRPEG